MVIELIIQTPSRRKTPWPLQPAWPLESFLCTGRRIEQMFSYGSAPASSNRFGHNLLPALITCINLRPPPTIYNPRRDESTPFASRTFICKMNLSFIKHATYSHFLMNERFILHIKVL